MKRKSLSVISILFITLMTACGSASQPTLSVTDIQNTAFPMVMTQYAQTKAAAPTVTPIPATPTALATFAQLPTLALETQPVAPVANPNATATPDCYTPPTTKLLGTTVDLNLVNRSGGPVNPLSMGMYKPNDQNECFTFTFNLRDKQTLSIKILSGCYWIAGFQTGPKPSTPRNNYICLTDTSTTRGITISNDSIGIN